MRRRGKSDEQTRTEVEEDLQAHGSPIENPDAEVVDLRLRPEAKVLYTIRLAPETVAKLGALARSRKTTSTAVARELIEKGVDGSTAQEDLVARVEALEARLTIMTHVLEAQSQDLVTLQRRSPAL